MGLLDKVKAGAEQAASTAQKQAQIVATKRELSQAYGDLGKTAYGLVDRGELGHGDLAAGVEHIRELQARLSGDGASADDADGGADIVE
ncbi:MAG TPA: hypothetical protein VID68_01275 [Solirubrobacteraceae bacterium]|jgi:pyridoxal biosynthesis lyase PdxS